MLRRPVTEQFCSHSFHSFQQYCNKQCYNWMRNRNGLKETRKRAVEGRNGLRKFTVPLQIFFEWSAVSSHELSKHEIMNSRIIILSNLMKFNNNLLLWKIFRSFCLYQYLLLRRGSKLSYAQFWRIRLLLSPSDDGKNAPYEKGKA